MKGFGNKKWKKAGHFLYETVYVGISLIVLLPFWMVLVNSLKERKEANLFGIFFPEEPLWENYKVVWESGNIVRGFCNGVFIALTAICILILCSSMAAYVFARRKDRMAGILYNIMIAGLVIPISMIPTFWVLRTLGLLNTYAGLILVYAACSLSFSIFLFTNFIKGVPRELDEAAFIDGASQVQVFFRVIFPLIRPITSTIFIFNFLSIWNDSQIQLFFADSDKWTMPMSVYRFFGQYGQDWNYVFADIILTMLPVILVYIFCQRYVISGMTAGAIKM